MPQFIYKAINEKKQIVKGRVSAETHEEAGLRLSRRHFIVLNLNEKNTGLRSGGRKRYRVTKKEVFLFTCQLEALNKSGRLPLAKAIEFLANQQENEDLKHLLRSICNDLSQGKSFSDALKAYPAVFPPFYVNSVHIGELSGKLDQVLKRLISHLEENMKLMKNLQKLMRYPMLVTGAMISAFIVFVSFVLPNFEPLFRKSGTDLPFVTKLLIFISQTLTTHWAVFLIFIFIAVIALTAIGRTERGKYWFDVSLLKLPVVGKLIKKLSSQRFASNLSLLTANGIPLLHGMDTVMGLEANRIHKAEIKAMKRSMERGQTIATAMAGASFFSELMLQMVSIGETTGTLVDMLDIVAKFITEEINHRIENIIAAIEPAITIFLSGMVLVLALSVFLPMWNMLSIK